MQSARSFQVARARRNHRKARYREPPPDLTSPVLLDPHVLIHLTNSLADHTYVAAFVNRHIRCHATEIHRRHRQIHRRYRQIHRRQCQIHVAIVRSAGVALARSIVVIVRSIGVIVRSIGGTQVSIGVIVRYPSSSTDPSAYIAISAGTTPEQPAFSV